MYMSLLKLVYHAPRPYMISDIIIPLSCSNEFGNPSGHSAIASQFAISFFLDVFHGAKGS